MDKTTFKILFFAMSLVLIIVTASLFFSDLTEKELEKKEIEPVTNINMFFTVESCVNKYISYLSAKDYEVIYNLLDDDYKKRHDITEENISGFERGLDGVYTFIAEEMYVHKIKKNIYYVKGYLMEEVMDQDSIRKPYYTTVKVNEKKQIFSIIPDGDGGILR